VDLGLLLVGYTPIAMITICLITAALSLAIFAHMLRKADEGREDDTGFHPETQVRRTDRR